MSDWIGPSEIADALTHGDGEGVRIAVLDSGIEIGHSDFSGRKLIDDLVFHAEAAPPSSQGSGEDPLGHGTAVASLIWRAAPRAQLGSFRVLGPQLRGRSAQVAAAAKEAIRRGYHLINCSFGSSLSNHVLLYKEWIDLAYLANVHVVAASSSRESSEWPAHFTSVLGVECGDGSSAGTFRHHQDQIVEFSIPPNQNLVAWNENSHRSMSGSSFSAAHFSGLLARLLSRHPNLNPLVTKALLAKVADHASCAELT